MANSANKKLDLIDEINALSDGINDVLNNKKKDKYFESLAVLYSFIEDVLKWLVFTQILWNKAEHGIMPPGEVEKIRDYCNQLNLYNLICVGLSVNLFDYQLFTKLDSMRSERNQLVHQYWLYMHKGNLLILRKKLEKLAGLSNTLVEILNKLVEETSVNASEGFFEVSVGRRFIQL